MSQEGQPNPYASFRAFWLTLLLLDLGLVAGGMVYAAEKAIAAPVAVPVIAAFVLQASLFVVPGFPEVRHWFEYHLAPGHLALGLALVSLIPYLIYAIPCGVFSWGGFAFLGALCFLISFVFVWTPPSLNALMWQDIVVIAALAYPWVSGLGSPLHEIFPSPAPGVPRLDYLGKLMLVTVGAMAYLSLRRLPRTAYRFAISRDDFLSGLRQFLIFVPPAGLLALSIGFVRWGPHFSPRWTYPFEIAGNALGIYLAVALPSEMFFRGVVQNLLAERLESPRLAMLIASVLFGLSHLGRGFPNWRYAAVTTLLGWFCGRAYHQRRSVVAASVTHTLAVLARRFLFA